MAPFYTNARVIKEQEDDDLLLLCLLLRKKNRKRKHRWWIHQIYQNRLQYGTFYHLIKELELDDDRFVKYFRLNKQQFKQVLLLVEPHLAKKNLTRQSISPKQMLAVCLRFLATGESFASLAYSYRLGRSTISKIIPIVCEVIWISLVGEHMSMPQTPDDWRLISDNFEEKWNFPHCIGALDGNHVVVQAPKKTGSTYFNYKGTFSVVLLALVDANLRFIYIDIGSFGRHSDGGILSHSNLGKAIISNSLHIPAEEQLPRAPELGEMPYVIVADEAFPLHKNIMRPYSGRHVPVAQRIFNYRLSRARRIVENAFGILASRWRIFFTRMAVKPTTVNCIVKACCVLHNMLQKETTPASVTSLFQQSDANECDGFRRMNRTGNRGSLEALDIRNQFKEYFLQYDKVSWQDDVVTRGMF